jgi:surface polysaccharide O-acyltransferase-like enzyme
MERKNGIDLFRLIAAFFIMLLHAGYGDLTTDFSAYIRMSGRWAVPFFFISTGYFLHKKITEDNRIHFRSIERNVHMLISILVVSSLVFMVYSLIFHYKYYANDIKCILIGSYWHLWFIGSMIFGYIFIWYFYSMKRGNLLLPISIIILISSIFADSYDNFFGISINYDELPKFFISVPFMYTGLLISKLKFSRNYLIIFIPVALLGFLLQYVEMNMFFNIFNCPRNDHQILIGTVVMVIPLFILSVNLKLDANIFSTYGRKYSLFIYLYHLIGYKVISLLLWKIFQLDINNFLVLFAFVDFIFITATAALLEKYVPFLFHLLNGNISQMGVKLKEQKL